MLLRLLNSLNNKLMKKIYVHLNLILTALPVIDGLLRQTVSTHWKSPVENNNDEIALFGREYSTKNVSIFSLRSHSVVVGHRDGGLSYHYPLTRITFGSRSSADKQQVCHCILRSLVFCMDVVSLGAESTTESYLPEAYERKAPGQIPAGFSSVYYNKEIS
jgi:hypothetical protein